MTTLYSSVIKLTSQHNVTLSHWGGQHAHAAFLDLIHTMDTELAGRLHDANARKPFTVSPILGLPQRQQSGKKQPENGMPGLYLREGWQCWLRVTMLDDMLFHVFLDRFLNGGSLPSIRIGDANFLVSEVLTTPGSHPWAGYVNLEELQKRLDEPAPAKFTFQLHTPTAFGWKDNLVATMPTPALVFGSLARAWDAIQQNSEQAFLGQRQAKVIESYAAENLLFSTFDLRTERITLHNKTQLGAVGRFEFIRNQKEDEPLARALHLLADLAFYTGLGRKTTQGMGMTSRI